MVRKTPAAEAAGEGQNKLAAVAEEKSLRLIELGMIVGDTEVVAAGMGIAVVDLKLFI